MKIFLSSEAEFLADKIISPFRNQISKQIDILLLNKPQDHYGADITTLCIISTCVSAVFLKNSNWKERVRYSKKDGTTDIRLNINYDKLLVSSEEEQYNLYLGNIIQSIHRFHLKYPELDFKADLLIDDITQICNLIR